MGVKIEDIVFGRWKVIKEIGHGSFGVVYEVVRKEFEREYHSALKVIQVPQDAEKSYLMYEGFDPEQVKEYLEDRINKIISELDLMVQLRGNSNIVSYEDHEVIKIENGIGYEILLRMELLEPLTKHIKQNGSLTELETVKLGIDMCNALELCEKKKIIHRDIKPQNIFISENGNYKLGDFGVSKQIEDTLSNLTRVGTYRFMAPEVFNGESYDNTVDIYSLGLVLYHFLNNGLMPFSTNSKTSYDEINKNNNRRLKGEKLPPPVHGCNELKHIVMKACEYNPCDRYRTAKEFRKDLESVRALLENESEKSNIPFELVEYAEEEIDSEKNTLLLTQKIENQTPEFQKNDNYHEPKGEIKNRKKRQKKLLIAFVALIVFALMIILIAASVNKGKNPNANTTQNKSLTTLENSSQPKQSETYSQESESNMSKEDSTEEVTDESTTNENLQKGNPVATTSGGSSIDENSGNDSEKPTEIKTTTETVTNNGRKNNGDAPDYCGWSVPTAKLALEAEGYNVTVVNGSKATEGENGNGNCVEKQVQNGNNITLYRYVWSWEKNQ